LIETFERAAEALPFEAEFRDIEIVAHSARRSGRTTALILVVDREGGADLALCASIASRLNALLDAETDPFTLEVESAGLERQLRRPADYERFRERPVRVVTTLALDGRKTFRGTLAGVRGNAAILRTPGGEFPIPLEMIKSANLEFDPREDLRREKRARKERA
jgi:ribosome maturation factor RimP